MNTTEITQTLEKNLKSKLRSLLPIEGHNDDLDAEFARFFDALKFTSDPYVEQIPFFQQDAQSTLLSLEESGLIEEETAELFARYFGCDKAQASLYSHQKRAIEDVCGEKEKNLVVCSGTGSGKTESFLIPLINSIIKERKECAREGREYQAGVRAMLLYPMNALVNDQLLRLRKILRGAQGTANREAIPYAQDISFGIYTGDVATLAEEKKSNVKLSKAKKKAICQADKERHEQVEHPYLSDEATLPTELTKRSQWQDKPADIFITNYSMLELLLLHGEVPALFSPTWQFIVLDEAHSYDGSLGTEIAWLIRRVKVRTGSDKLRYLATSATLIEEGDEMERRTKIQNDFASKIFPAPPESFSVQFGELHLAQTDDGDSALKGDYLNICHLEDKILSQIVMEKVSEQIRPRKMQLLAITQWADELKRWLASLDYLKTHVQSESCALGDALALAKMIRQLDKDVKLSFNDNYTIPHIRAFINDANGDDFSNDIRDLLGYDFNKDTKELQLLIEDWAENECYEISVDALLLIVSYVVKCTSSLEGNTAPLEWRVQWTDASQQKIEDFKNQLNNYHLQLQDVQEELHQAWARTLKHNTPFPQCLNDYISERVHYSKLSNYLSVNEEKECQLSRIVEHVFGACTDENTQEFNALCQLLSLTKHPKLRGKPLMDLRFHQLIKGIRSMGVHFDKEFKPHLLPDNDQLSIDCNGTKTQQFNLACCIDCGHPFLLAYSQVKDMSKGKTLEKASLNRYRSAQSPYLHVLSWTPSEKNKKASFGLDVEQGILHKNSSASRLPIYHYAKASDKGYIVTCPVCEARSNGNDIIAPYQSKLDNTRVASILSLINLTDSDANPLQSNNTQGRKLLAFSDSRAKAAGLAHEFDTYVEERLIERFLLECLEELRDDTREKAFARLERIHDDFIQNRSADDAFQEITYGRKLGVNVIDFEKNWYEQYKNSLLLIAPLMIEKLEKAGAKYLLTREYEIEGKGEVKSYTELASAILSCLSILRQTGRLSFFRSGVFKVYSHKQRNSTDNKEWKNIVKSCGSEEIACEIFEQIYHDLYRRTLIDTSLIDAHQGKDYENDPAFEANTEYFKSDVSWDAKETFRFSKQEKIRAQFKDKLDKEDFDDIFSTIFIFLKNEKILVSTSSKKETDTKKLRYRLNLDDIRFELSASSQEVTRLKEDLNNELYYRIEEHTAQLSTAQARLYQELFASGKINILSSSTTFEMGVDLGNLNCVFLCNMPPKTANYRQRAGRAGRRAGSASYVFTFVGDSSHDRYFAENTHELIFGKMSPPQIYLQNTSFRAKHLRAEAFHHFIQHAVKDRPWKQCGSFFRDDESKGKQAIVKHLPAWAREAQTEVQEHCHTICEGLNEIINYDVVYDLCFQLTGFDAEQNENMQDFREDGMSQELAGVHLYAQASEDNYWIAPLYKRFTYEYEAKEKTSAGQLSYLINQSTIQYIAKTRVFPRYGFPCDLIELVPDESERKSVRLSRDLKLGIFEFSPGQEVIANKSIYRSKRPIFYSAQKIEGNETNEKQLYSCSGKDGESEIHYFMKASTTEKYCPICRADICNAKELKTATPDAFQAEPSINNRRRKYQAPIHRIQIYNGGNTEEYAIPQLNLSISQSASRELLYFNNKCEKGRGNESIDGILHTVRTDMVIWEAISPIELGDDERTRHAWQSAIEAIVRATALVCEVNERDVGGLYTTEKSKPHIVLFDNSASGSGIIMRMFVGADEKANPSVDAPVAALCHKILQKAHDLCNNCLCYGNADEGKAEPRLREEYLNSGGREYHSCYKCLKNYSNQIHHSRLDAHDAAFIIRSLMTPHSTAAGTEQETGKSVEIYRSRVDNNKGRLFTGESWAELDYLPELAPLYSLPRFKNCTMDGVLQIIAQGSTQVLAEMNALLIWADARCVLFEEDESAENQVLLQSAGWKYFFIDSGFATADLIAAISQHTQND